MDTNVLLWYFWGSPRVNPIKQLIESEETNVYFSSASLWEIALKVRNGKLMVDPVLLRSFAKRYAFIELPMTGDHIEAYLKLPNLHKDPFDHMLLAQAITSPMRLITDDALLADYSSLVMVI